jgi:hypothetical protein
MLLAMLLGCSGSNGDEARIDASAAGSDASATGPGDAAASVDATSSELDADVCGCEDDGLACTIAECNASTGQCEQIPDDSICDDGVHCNGVETCDSEGGCQHGGGRGDYTWEHGDESGTVRLACDQLDVVDLLVIGCGVLQYICETTEDDRLQARVVGSNTCGDVDGPLVTEGCSTAGSLTCCFAN